MRKKFEIKRKNISIKMNEPETRKNIIHFLEVIP